MTADSYFSYRDNAMTFAYTGIEADAIVPPALFGRVKAYIPGYVEPKEEWE